MTLFAVVINTQFVLKLLIFNEIKDGTKSEG